MRWRIGRIMGFFFTRVDGFLFHTVDCCHNVWQNAINPKATYPCLGFFRRLLRLGPIHRDFGFCNLRCFHADARGSNQQFMDFFGCIFSFRYSLHSKLTVHTQLHEALRIFVRMVHPTKGIFVRIKCSAISCFFVPISCPTASIWTRFFLASSLDFNDELWIYHPFSKYIIRQNSGP